MIPIRFYIIGALALALAASIYWQDRTQKKLNATRVELSHAQETIEVERNDRRLSDATIDRLNKDLDDLRSQPPITGVRCKTARKPAESGSSLSANAGPASLVEGMPAEPSVGDEVFGPEIDVSQSLDWYGEQCARQAIELSRLQEWERLRAH